MLKMTNKVNIEASIENKLSSATISELNKIIEICQKFIDEKKNDMKKSLSPDIIDQLEELQRLKEKQLTNPKEAAKLIGVSRVSIYRWIKKGILEGHKFGGVVRIKRKDLENFIKIKESQDEKNI